MSTSLTVRPHPRRWVLLAVALVIASAVVAQAQFGGFANQRQRPKMEYLNQEVQADQMVTTLNDLDGQGWDLFQLVPVWSVKDDNGTATLVAKTYQVFGRRPVANPPEVLKKASRSAPENQDHSRQEKRSS